MNDPTILTTANLLGISVGFLGLLILVVSLWSIAWKGWALWIAARNNHKKWFIVLLVINTLGILEIIYIFAIGKKALEEKNGS